MLPILLLVGLLLLVIGLAALFGDQAAASRRLRAHSRRYALATTAGGVVLATLGLVGILAR